MSEILPSLKALRHLVIPSNGFRSSGVARDLITTLKCEESGFPRQLKTLNIGNNLFKPLDLLSICKTVLSEELPCLKKLVIAFSDLGRDDSA